MDPSFGPWWNSSTPAGSASSRDPCFPLPLPRRRSPLHSPAPAGAPWRSRSRTFRNRAEQPVDAILRGRVSNTYRAIGGWCRQGRLDVSWWMSRTCPTSTAETDRTEYDVMLIFVYTPVLLFLPVLLLGGIVFVMVPAAFIVVVVAAAYLAWIALSALIVVATTGLHAARVSRRRDRPSLAP